jgi:hypothetical protein
MKIHQYPTVVLLFLFSIAVLAEDTKERHSLKQTAKGDILYSRFTFYFLKEQHTSTNYRMGTLIPINSKFEFVKTSWAKRRTKPPFYGQEASFRVKHVVSGQIIKIANIKKYSGSDASGYFLKMFSKDKTDLSSFTEKERQYILIGRVLSGMSKKGVILALGYPPVHKTPSLNNPIWHYWNSKLGTFTVQFLDDKIIELNSIK